MHRVVVPRTHARSSEFDRTEARTRARLLVARLRTLMSVSTPSRPIRPPCSSNRASPTVQHPESDTGEEMPHPILHLESGRAGNEAANRGKIVGPVLRHDDFKPVAASPSGDKPSAVMLFGEHWTRPERKSHA